MNNECWLTTSDPGILKKKADLETGLFVFGYSCKIFRDDQKALEMDQGKQLIPWMGNDSIKIDRYDARGQLSDLSQFEGREEDYIMTSEERRVEELCDEERYYGLLHHEEENYMYQEEQLKRFKQALGTKVYGQVAYDYTDRMQSSTGAATPAAVEEFSEPFVPNPLLDIPKDMVLPATQKEHKIIEKTAAYIASLQHQGPQFEILIKTKQASNKKFNFLYAGTPLNAYYMFILGEIKAKRYRYTYYHEQEDDQHQENSDYLHMSLQRAISAPTQPIEVAHNIPNIDYKPDPNCLYNQLVKRIRIVQENREASEKTSHELGPSKSVNVDHENSTSSSKRKSEKRPATVVDNNQVQFPICGPAPSSGVDPPQTVKDLISRLVSYVISSGSDPSELGRKLLLRSKNFEFVKPGTPYYDYYRQHLQKTTNEISIQTVEPETSNAFSNGNHTSDVYNPALPTSEDGSEEDIMCDPETHIETDLETSGDGSTRSDKIYSPDPDENNEMELDTGSIDSLTQETPRNANNQVQQKSPRAVLVTTEVQPAKQPSKPAVVSFIIKKPKEVERLENASAFPLEESSSEGEGGEEKEPLMKSIEIERQKVADLEKQNQQPIYRAELRVKHKLARAGRGNVAARNKYQGRRLLNQSSAEANCTIKCHTRYHSNDRSKHHKRSETKRI